MPNTLIIPNSGTIFFSTETAGASTTPALTGQAVSLAHDGQAGLIVTSLNTSTSATNRFRVNGANGALLAVTDEITGTVFSVNDPAGLPIISADTGLNDVITIGTFGSNALVVRNDRVGIGTSNPNTSAALEIVSTTRGFRPPVMNLAQRTAIAAPAAGLVVYTSDAFALSLHNGTAWGNVLTTHATSFTADTLRIACSQTQGTGSLVFATGPSLVGPVNITSQDATTADRVMTRGLGDVRYSRSIIAIATTNQDAFDTATPVASTQCVINITEPGVYFIETSEQVVSSAWATAGAICVVTATGSATDGVAFGCQSTRSASSFLNQQFVYNNNWMTFQQISHPSQSLWVMRTGLVTFNTAGTIALSFCQFTAVSGQFARLQARSFIRATRIA